MYSKQAQLRKIIIRKFSNENFIFTVRKIIPLICYSVRTLNESILHSGPILEGRSMLSSKSYENHTSDILNLWCITKPIRKLIQPI